MGELDKEKGGEPQINLGQIVGKDHKYEIAVSNETLFTFFKASHHEYEYRDRTHTGNCNRYINFADSEVFKLFCGRIFDRRGYLGVNAP